MKMRLAVSVCLFSGLTLAQQPLPAQSRKLLIAALDSDFPPYNYIDERGVQAGFSLELIRAIARLSGVEIEIRSAPWHDIVRDLKKGRIDLTAMAETEKRREEFDFLSHVWNLRQVVMYPANREVYPRHLDELSHETVAVLPKSLVHELLLTLPEVRRPTLLFVSTSDEAVRSLVRGESTAVAGNELTLQFIMARNRSLRLKTVPVRSTAYHIVTSKGRAGEFAFVEKAMMRLRQTGEFEQLVEHHLILSRPPPWTGYALYLGYALAGLSLILTSIIAWNRSLRKKIKIHTREIAESLEEKMNEIRQREHTELKLRQANGRFESLINTLDGVVWEADPHTATFTFVSAPAEKLLGYPLADWYQDGFWARHIHPEDRHEAVSFCLAATARRQNHTFEYRMVAAGGSHVWVRDFVTVVVEDGVLKSLRGILLDVTELKLAEEALRDTERLTRIVIDSAPDAVVQMDAKALIQDWNTQSEALFGWSRAEAIGRQLSSCILPARLRPEQEKSLSQAMASGQTGSPPDRFELTAAHKDGREFPVELSLSPVQYRGETIFTLFLRDISRRREAETELARARDEALKASQLKSEFLANMSHEIRTPMNGVLGMAGLLLNTGLDQEQREYAHTIRISGEALLEIINDILDFSKIEAGKLTLETQSFDLEETACDIVDLLSSEAAGKGLEMLLSYPPDVPRRLVGDPGRIRQILLNLTANAVKFTECGQVHLDISCPAMDDSSALIRLTVNDTGIGIHPDQQEQLFKKFSQLDSSSTRKFGGTGLGLAICRQLCDLMGGAMGVQSQPGAGSTFWFQVRLPLDSTGLPAAPPELAGMRALLVCREKVRLRNLNCCMSAWNMVTVSAPSAEEAKAMMRQSFGAGYDVVILDQDTDPAMGREISNWVRPGRTGLVLLSTLRQRGRPLPGAYGALVQRIGKPVRPILLMDALARVRQALKDPGNQRAKSGDRTAGADSLPNGLRVLVVEDNPVNQRVATRMLEKLRCEVDIAADGAEALLKLEGHAFDLLFMDCHMPGMDGYQATQEIRNREAGTSRHIPIIAMTASAMTGDREKCLRAGMDDYISKPINMDQLRLLLLQHGHVQTSPRC